MDARTGRPGVAESVLDATSNGGKTPIDVTANGVTIDGFTVQNETSSNVFGFGIVLGVGTSGWHVLNNIIQNNLAGLALANNSSSAQTVIQDNLFLNNNQSGPANGNAIYSDQFVGGTTVTNVLIDSNAFTGNNNSGVALVSSQANTQSNITISNNTFTNDGNAVVVADATATSITGNTITGSVGSQIAVLGGVNGLSIMQNFIDNGATNGVRILVDGTASSAPPIRTSPSTTTTSRATPPPASTWTPVPIPAPSTPPTTTGLFTGPTTPKIPAARATRSSTPTTW